MPPSTVIPELVYEDVGEAIGWLCDKFGFQVRWQAGDHRAQLWLNGGTVVVTEPRTSRALPGPQSLLVRVADARAHFERARERGAKILEEPRDFSYGERQYAVEDLGGHHWGFSQSIADVAPEEWGGTTGPALHAPGQPVGTHLSVMLIVPDAAAAISWYRNALGLAYQLHNQAAVEQMNAALMKNYPTAQNLSNAILIYNSGTELPKDIQLDLYRLMFASGGMTQSGEYLQLATMLETSGLPGEEQTVLQRGISSGKLGGASAQQMLQRSSARITEDRASLPGVEQKARAAATGTLALSTASAYASYGDYAKAIDLYHVALQKGGVDPNVVNTRLGIALAQAGRRSEAEAAFHAVTGPRTQLASLWLTWLAQHS